MEQTEPKTTETTPAAQVQSPSNPERGFAESDLLVLRPVLEADLPELAKLLAENPYDRDREPWTFQRLKQKFEDKDKPGMWEDRKHYYTVARKQGGVVGFVIENQDGSYPPSLWNCFYIKMDLPDRNELGADLLRIYFAFKQRWHDPQRICFSISSVQPDEARWLADAGYELELIAPHAVLVRGEPASEMVFSWICPRLLALRSDDGPVAGEPGAEVISVPNGGDRHGLAGRD